MSSNNNKPRLRFPEFTGEWVEKTLGGITDICYGTRVVQAKDGGSIYPVYGGGGATFKMDTYNREDCVVISRFAMSQTCTRRVTGKFFLNDSGLTLNAHEELAQSYLDYYVISQNDAIYKTAEGMAQKNLSIPSFKALLIRYPKSKVEQEKIASCLMEMDNLISIQKQKVETIKKNKKGLIQQLFPQQDDRTPRLRFPGFAGEWERKKLGEMITEVKNTTTDSSNIPLYSLTIEEGITVKTDRYERGFLVTKKDNVFKVVSPNDFVSNPMNLRFGAIAYNKNPFNVSVSGYYDVFRFKDPRATVFWSNYLKSDLLLHLYDINAIGSLLEKRRVYFSTLQNLELLVPSSPEQQKIAECLTALDELIASESAKLDSLKDHKKGLMQQLFPQPSK